VRSEPRRLGAFARLVVCIAALVAVGLVVATAAALALRDRRLKREATSASLNAIAFALRNTHGLPSSATSEDRDRMEALTSAALAAHRSNEWHTREEHYALLNRFLSGDPRARDVWGHPIRFQAPGPIHSKWDLWSVGPNGIDELGGGDDILVGEDVTDVSRR